MLLRAHNLCKTYLMGRTSVRVLRGTSLALEAGEFLVVKGASGSGKSTLLHLLGGLDVPTAGVVEFNGKDIFAASERERRIYRNRHVGFVFQFFHLLPELNVLENVLIPRMVACSAWRWRSVRSEARRDAEALIERVGLSERINHRPKELSGGESQRVAIARALINRPALLLADEPTGNLDAVIGGGILRLFTEFNEAGQAIVMVTHDRQVASRAHRCVELGDGVLQEAKMPGVRHTADRPEPKEVAP